MTHFLMLHSRFFSLFGNLAASRSSTGAIIVLSKCLSWLLLIVVDFEPIIKIRHARIFGAYAEQSKVRYLAIQCISLNVAV